MSLSPALQISLKDDRGGYLVDKTLVFPAGLLSDTRVDHRPMGHNRRETLVVIFDGDAGHALLPATDKLLDPLKVLTRLSVRLHGFSDHDAFH